MKFKYIFGPVPSRRLGFSLGLDIVPHKTCNFNCIYCECGRTINLTNERKSYFDCNEIFNEIENYLKSKKIQIDYITFSGAGEPLLNGDIIKIAKFIKKNFKEYKLALLTNGSLFCERDIIENINLFDVILPSLDAASETTFKKINRPHKEISFLKLISSLKLLREKYKGKIWLETFFVKDLNDSEYEIKKMKKIISQLDPDKIQINTVDRPPAYSSVKPVDFKKLKFIEKTFGDKAEIISRSFYENSINEKNISIIKNCLMRRPLTIEDLSKITGLNYLEINKILSLINAKSEKVNNKIFFKI